MTVYFPVKITNFKLYSNIMDELSRFYMNGETMNPVLSFANTEFIEYETIPVLMGIIDIIFNVNKEPVYLEFVNRTNLLNCLKHSNFFKCADEFGYISYDKEIIEEIYNDNNNYSKKLREAHILHYYMPFMGFFNKSKTEQEVIRNELLEKMYRVIIPLDFNVVMQDIKQLWTNQLDNFTVVLSELISNSILYSQSICYAFFYSNKYNTKMSICDVGGGLENSLKFRRGEFPYLENKVTYFNDLKYKYKYLYPNYSLDSFFLIMEALYYSELKERINLFYLKKLVVNNKGKIRIHTGNTQVIFTSKRCENCNKQILECIPCLLHGVQYNSKHSPVRIFDWKLKGVRIEIEFDR